MAEQNTLSPAAITLIVIDALLVVALIVIFVTWPNNNAAQVSDEPTQAADPSTDASGLAQNPELEETTEVPHVKVPNDALGVTAFQLPSGNIWCQLGNDAADCVIEKFQYARPSINDCSNGESGYRWTVSADGAAPVCGKAPKQPSGLTKLAYGTATVAGDVLCESDETGVRCRSISTGHGFHVRSSGTRTF